MGRFDTSWLDDNPLLIPIPIRADFTARVHIPVDLTEAEAKRIAAVILAFAIPASPEPPQ